MIFLSNDAWEVKETKNKGKGIFAKKSIAPGVVIGDYMGVVLRTKDVDINEDKEHLYLMYYHDGESIFPNVEKPGIHLLNHSCSPNAWLSIYKGHTLAFTLRHIFSGEELTISYLLAPKNEWCSPCPHTCKCGSPTCSHSMHLSKEKYKKWRLFCQAQAKKDTRAIIRYGKELPLLSYYPKTISDNPIYDLFGTTQQPPIKIAGTKLPSVKEIRNLIRSTGRIIDMPKIKTRIYGVADNCVISGTYR